MIRNAMPADAKELCSIYNHYIEHTIITFEEETLSVAEFEQRIINISSKYPYIVYEEEGKILGYAYASAWRTRPAYRFSVETTIYLAPSAEGRGIGTMLYQELESQARTFGFHALLGCITIPNEKSIALHKKMGYKKVAEFEEVGFKFGQCLNVGFWEKILK